MSKGKGIHWLVWVGGGCALMVMLVGAAIVGVGFFAAKKVSDVATELTENPVTTLAKTYALTNKEIEFVEADEGTQTVTFRNTATGETSTFDFSELKAGNIKFENSSGESVSISSSADGVAIDAGEEQIRIGASQGGVDINAGGSSARLGGASSDVPEWVPRPPGAALEVGFTASSSDGQTGGFQVEGDSVDAVAAEWKQLLIDSGYTIESEISQGGAQQMKIVVGKQEAEGRQVSVAVTEHDGGARAVISYASGQG